MQSRTLSLSQRMASVIAVLAVIMTVFLVFPANTAHAAGTDLYVGYSGKSNNFSTVQDAVNKAASINPSNESQRVTIHIAPGTYRQQVVVQTPFIKFVNDEPSKGDVVLTWYYGIGYKYYSANSKGYYDANLANSKSGKNVANYRWGATVQLWPKATNFQAENIVFENSFNRYLTKEEIADGVECTNETLKVQRTNGVDVQSKAYTERAAALSADTAYCEFLNCKFYSSQDTLYIPQILPTANSSTVSSTAVRIPFTQAVHLSITETALSRVRQTISSAEATLFSITANSAGRVTAQVQSAVTSLPQEQEAIPIQAIFSRTAR